MSTKLPNTSPNNLVVSSQSGILLGDAQLPDFIPVSTAAPDHEISHSLGASGFKGVQIVQSQQSNNPKKERQPVQKVTSPPLFGGFSSNEIVKEAPKRPERPEKKPQPIYNPAIVTTVGPTYKPISVKKSTTVGPTPTITYDPFSFQSSPKPAQERRDFKEHVQNLQDEIQASIRTVTPYSTSLGYEDESNTIVPVFLTSDTPPELRRVPKHARSGGPAPTPSAAENEITDR